MLPRPVPAVKSDVCQLSWKTSSPAWVRYVEVDRSLAWIAAGGDVRGEVVVAGAYRFVEGAHDAVGVVVGALLEVGPAVEPELDAAGWLPGAEVWFGEVEVAMRVEAEAAGVVDGAEDQVLGEGDRRGEWSGVVGAEEVGDECGQVASVDDAGWDGVLDALAVGVDQVSAGAGFGVVVFADDADAGQAGSHGQWGEVGVVDPVRWPVGDGQAVAPLPADPTADEPLVGYGSAFWSR